MKEKRTNIPKKEAYSLFIKAFELADISYELVTKDSGVQVAQPGTKWYYELADKIEKLYPQVKKHSNYPSYLKDKYNRIKLIIENDSVEEFTYHREHFSPLIRFARQKFEGVEQLIFVDEVFMTQNRFTPFNLWRTAAHGKLSRASNFVIFENEDESISLKSPTIVEELSMPPHGGRWLKLQTDDQTLFFAVKNQDRVGPVDRLLTFLQ